MKMLAEYLEHAIQFERMADTEDGALKEQFLKQAEEYQLAEKRAIQIGFRKPPPQSQTIASERGTPPA
jgi:hypothetical protein